MSVNQLAASTQREFLRLGERVGSLEKKVEGGFSAVIEMLDSMRSDIRHVKLTDVEDRVRDLERRVRRLEKPIAAR